MIFRTQNSTYEIDTEGKRIRRLYGANDPEPRQGQDGEWKAYEEVTDIEPGIPVIVVWRRDGLLARSTILSRVVDVGVVLN